MIKRNEIENILGNRFGVMFDVIIKQAGNNFKVDIKPRDVNVLDVFLVRITKGWRSITADFVPGKYSGLFIKELGETYRNSKTLFMNIAKEIFECGYEIRIQVNGQKFNDLNPEKWDEEWRNIKIKLKKTPIDYNEMSSMDIKELYLSISTKMIGLIMSLITLEENTVIKELEGLPEGSKSRIEVNKYERNLLNRALCIDVKGKNCSVCEFDFGEYYGEIGEGFIHVHHTTPVSEIGDNYIINPIKDLIPVCPNCHAMLHKSKPPLSIEELKEKISYNF